MSESIVNENAEMKLIVTIKREKIKDGHYWMYLVDASGHWGVSGGDENLSDAKSNAIKHAEEDIRNWNIRR